MFDAAVARAMPEVCLPPCLPAPPRGRTVVVGAGKAAAAMATAVEKSWAGPLSGLVVTRYGHEVSVPRIEVVQAAHPIPDEAGQRAAQRILTMVGAGLTADDLVLCLISGGGSALLTLPAPGLTLGDKQIVNQALLKSGATIAEMNCVRKHLSAIKGGRLAAACGPAPVITLAISDVPGDDPAVIASGPTVADPTTYADALSVLEKYRIDSPLAVTRHLKAAVGETPKPGDPRLARAITQVIATAQDSLEAAAAVARQSGVTPLILSDCVEGEAREVARVHAAIARQVLRHQQPVAPPCVLLSGGETSVTVRGTGRGGRNVEFLLALAVALGGEERVHALAGDTDGIDGTEDNAGAVITPDTLARATAVGLHAGAHLASNDAYSFFAGLGDLVVSGPTRTNVNDFRAVFIAGP
ncbi:MAG: glycerate kinase [Myxococcales bacterium]